MASKAWGLCLLEFRNIIRRIIIRIRKQYFGRQFRSFDISSSIGSNGLGKGCKLSGLSNICVGKDCYFGENTELTAIEYHANKKMSPSIIIGNHVRCIGGCRVTCAGSIVIKDNVLLGPEVFITDHNHGMDPTISDGYSQQQLIVKDVIIGEGVWIGQRGCVLPGVTIGEHSIIGANSVVTHSIPPYVIAVGAPARIIKRWNNDIKEWVNTN